MLFFLVVCKLALIQLRIEAALCKQLFVVACFYNISILHDKDDVRIADGRKAVCDDEAGASFGQTVHRLLNQQLVLVSTLEVASSRIKIFGLERMVLAMVSSCF